MEIRMWEERYNTEDYVFGREPAAFLRRHESWLKRGEFALSVADGEGRNSVFLAEKGLKVIAWDGAPTAVEKARALAHERGVAVAYEVADIEDWAWPEARFDLVLGVFIQFVGPEARARLFERMKRAVKPGGVLMLHGYTPKQLDYGTGGPKAVENLYTPELLREAFGDLEIRELEAYEAELDEGGGHVGRSALIDLVAVKPLS